MPGKNSLRKLSCLGLMMVVLFNLMGSTIGVPAAAETNLVDPKKAGKSNVDYPDNDDDKKACTGGVSATAKLVGKGIQGTIKFDQVKGVGAMVVRVSVTGLPTGKHPYHIHEHEVVGGDCATTLGHFNPTKVPATQKCTILNPRETCQVGDLTGLFGPLNPGSNEVQYFDPLLKFSPATSSILGKSVVIHSPDLKDRIACGNIVSDSTTK